MKLDVGRVLQDGWHFLLKYPGILLVAFIGVLIEQILGIQGSVIATAVGFVGYFLTFFVMTQYVYEVRHGKPTWKGAWLALRPKWLFLFLTTFLYILALIAGFCFLIIPGIIFIVRLGAYDYTVMFENAGIIDSFKKSWALTQGSFWRILTVILILYLPCIISELIPKSNYWMPVSMSLQTFFQAWWTITMTLVYFELKNIKQSAVVQGA